MKKFLTAFLIALFAMPAFSAEAPTPILANPRNGQTGLFYGGISVVWDFNTIKRNPDATLECTLIWPDGREQVINGMIQDANGSETEPPFPQAEGKPYVDNALLFVNVNFDREKFESIFMKGKYELNIPEGILYIDVNSVGPDLPQTEPEWVLNEAATLTFYASEGEDPSSSGIISISEENETVYYDLQGRRVLNPERGLYILNGKKVMK